MPNQDFNIDDFKKSWQEQQVLEVYQSSEIEAMLNKKSRNYELDPNRYLRIYHCFGSISRLSFGWNYSLAKFQEWR